MATITTYLCDSCKKPKKQSQLYRVELRCIRVDQWYEMKNGKPEAMELCKKCVPKKFWDRAIAVIESLEESHEDSNNS